MGGEDLPDLLADSWDLEGIDGRYRQFIEDHQSTAERIARHGPDDAQDAFVTYLRVVDQWRKLPYRAPGLPRQVLPTEWSAPTAGALFEQLVSSVEKTALAHAADHWPGSDPNGRA